MYTPVCYRHQGREATIQCQRCGRPICVDCMIEASVGFQCPDCVAAGRRQTRSHLGPYGGRRSQDPSLSSKAIIAVNVIVWLLALATNGVAGPVVSLLALTPLGTCVDANNPAQIVGLFGEASCNSFGSTFWVDGVASGAFWQIITKSFTHVDLWHIGFNMLALWILGPQLEAILGRARFLALYFVSALTAACFVMWLSAFYLPTLGASGAIFGMMGAILVLSWKHNGDVRSILIWLGANAAITFVGGAAISWQGHLGGFVGGTLVVLAFAYAPRYRRSIAWYGVAAITVAGLALIAARAFQLSALS